MTNEEIVLEQIRFQKRNAEDCVIDWNVLDYLENMVQENTKLKAEIDELKSKIVSLNYENTDLKEEVGANILWSKCVEKTLKKEIDKNTKLCEEIAELKGEK